MAESDVSICWLCTRPLGERVEWHHPIPKSRGGREKVAIHPICHRTLHARFSNGELQRPLPGPVAQNFLQFLTERKDLVGIAESHASRLVKFKTPADTVEELVAERFFQKRELSADRLRRQVQLFAGTANAAAFRHDPEIMKMFVVERAHGLLYSIFSN